MMLNYVFLVLSERLVVPRFPRCASTSILRALAQRYADARSVPVAWPMASAWRGVALWREPLERFESVWRFLGHTEKGRAYFEHHHPGLVPSLPVLVELAGAPEVQREWHLRSQSYLELDLDCERIPWDLERMASALDTGPIEQENDAPELEVPWTPELEAEVKRIYADDFTIWSAIT